MVPDLYDTQYVHVHVTLYFSQSKKVTNGQKKGHQNEEIYMSNTTQKSHSETIFILSWRHFEQLKPVHIFIACFL